MKLIIARYAIRVARFTARGGNFIPEGGKIKGRGLNSIPIRFTLMALVFTALCTFLQYHYVLPLIESGTSDSIVVVAILLSISLPAAITYFAANKLTNTIRELNKSTDAIAAGDFDRPVDVDCACEVGSLADSFRAMVNRLNSNIVRINTLAYTDAVTGLPNRAVVSHVLDLAARMRGSADCKGALMFIDLDGFKRINDTLGHEGGDELLRQVSRRVIEKGFNLTRGQIENCTTAFGELRQTCPEKLVFARFAGDEFVAIMPGEFHRRVLEKYAADILKAVNEPFLVSDNELRIGASIGIARVTSDSDDPRQLLINADIAMYSAKESGKNQYRFFDESLKNIAVERSQIEADLRKAIEEDMLDMHYQPKLNAQTLQVTGVEALVRWKHPQKGAIPPARFVGIAEQCGLMPALGTNILRMVARQARAWQEVGMPMPIAVNVSAVQFERSGIANEILAILEQHAVDPLLIEIELTESMIMSDFATAKSRLEQLREAGAQISIDDFGTGYSNLYQLSHLPFNVLKIDKSLVDDIGKNSKSEAIVTAIVQMVHSLGHRVVAEGVETHEQYAFLRKARCDQVQGYLFGRPMPAHELIEWVSDHASDNGSMNNTLIEKVSRVA
ncbi:MULTISPECIES: EAL domain-containing protein [Nitrosomonas]|uniref:Diguanylate cyclase/phosphodiesterase domain 2 (EAL) n=1 Tax=Nitrosomonas europaea (strain ATCC 19718 / CIP 103999 / KCTC 2705 / NBRC 14298) TaxID=228410 RepID=Q82TH8_NITEU|nr:MULTISPECIES: EAL domain-containing protein [Nitrosomonas]CAD85820.1 Diguanylate cyclase/phosphodiesterase domain 2 (EAL) [Nitrosomonas europaea ATCC 19718]SDW56861.1 diguanylate cyclase/phosphodiesterase [Nitrosomonas europaea]SET17776.1 diguanylate cyclase/phosphodiesterase [Nitrosomonas europaea]SJZ67325.1 diguanylate cyclase/phosphodiesterase [Nitrosomonas europaea]HBF24809.1 GGDEF domain-containing protein [Nitrosomonas sp.]